MVFVSIVVLALIFILPIYIILDVGLSFSKKGNLGRGKFYKFISSMELRVLFSVFTLIANLTGLSGVISDISATEPLKIYVSGELVNYYTPLAKEHIPLAFIFIILGLTSYYIFMLFSKKLPPIIYAVCSSLLIVNIIFTIMYITHIWGRKVSIGGYILAYSLVNLSLLFVATLRRSLRDMVEENLENSKEYKSKFLNFIYKLTLKYQTIPLLWGLTFFPVIFIIQLLLFILGQQPDSIIRIFLDTSSFNYSAITPPPPVILQPSDGHYLCTVSLKGHKKIVKPLRIGIRGGERILVNRQLLIANAFENILEEYTPKFHRVIRNFYDKYGFPISKYIKTSTKADIIYLLMKPLEWIFLLILYSVDRNPENRINIQYSELRRGIVAK